MRRLEQSRHRVRGVTAGQQFDSSLKGLVLHLSMSESETRLEELFALYGSDKGSNGIERRPYPWPPHNYAVVYEFLFRNCRQSVVNLVECGIGTNHTDTKSNMTSSGRPGASLRAWRDYFPRATIHGLDIDSRILFSEDRILTYQVDQTDSRSVESFWTNSGVTSAEIIIDDGLHTFEAGVAFFEASFPYLAQGGIYVIEDVSNKSFVRFCEYFAGRRETVAYLQLHRDGLPLGDNTLIVVRKPPGT